MPSKISALDFSLVESAVSRTQRSLELPRASTAFIHTVLDAIYPDKEQDNEELITDGPSDRGIDAIYIRDRGGDVQVDLFSFKYREAVKTCNKNFEAEEVQKIRSFIADLFSRNEEVFRAANAAIKSKCRDIWSLFDSGKMCRFKIFLVSNGLELAEDERGRMDHFCKSYDRISFEEINFFAIVRLLSDGLRRCESSKLKAVDGQIFDRSDGDVRGVVANIEVASLLEAIRDENTGGIKRHLFGDNIRVYLGDDGGYNKEIISSALSEDDHLFWYLNNGITIVCEHVDYQKGARSPIINLTGFQIVNGAQTCNALFSAYQREPEKVARILLLVKVFETNRRDISNRVAIATNSQARINLRDLHSNDEIQKKIEQVFLAASLFYERKKNQHLDKLSIDRVDALKLGQMILSYHVGEPDKAKTESDSIFGHRYSEIFHDRHDGQSLLGLVKIYDEIERRRDDFRLAQRSATSDEGERRFLSYGHWHILFAVSMLARRDGLIIPLQDDIIKYVDEAVQVVSKIVGEYKTVAHYDMFRSSRFRQRLLAEFNYLQLRFDL